MKNNILVLGSGAREHALVRALHSSPQKKEIFCLATNINPGISSLCNELSIKDINDIDSVVTYAQRVGASLVIVGPENPLACGVVDALLRVNIKTVGPTKKLAQLETSKTFTRNLLKKHNIPGGPKYKTFNSLDGTTAFLNELGRNYVVKNDGLAGGKGVKVSGEHLFSHEEALSFCQELLRGGNRFIVEEKLVGEEFSLMSFCDGETLKHMPVVQDHKRAYEGDLGPNTGGMGTYSDTNHSLPFLTNDDISQAQKINVETASALKKNFNEGYKGIIYGGFMVTADGLRLIEYNARFGDPEAINVLSLIETDFIELCHAIVDGTLIKTDVRFKKKATVCKYAVPEGYPNKPKKGEPIDVSGVSNPDCLFFASVNIKNKQLVGAGSRALAVVGVGNSISEAEKKAEKEVSAISGNLFHRSDIGTESLIQKKIKQMSLIR